MAAPAAWAEKRRRSGLVVLVLKVRVQDQSAQWEGEGSAKAPARVREGEVVALAAGVTAVMCGSEHCEVMLVVISKLPDESEKLVRPVEAAMRGAVVGAVGSRVSRCLLVGGGDAAHSSTPRRRCSYRFRPSARLGRRARRRRLGCTLELNLRPRWARLCRRRRRPRGRPSTLTGRRAGVALRSQRRNHPMRSFRERPGGWVRAQKKSSRAAFIWQWQWVVVTASSAELHASSSTPSLKTRR